MGQDLLGGTLIKDISNEAFLVEFMAKGNRNLLDGLGFVKDVEFGVDLSKKMNFFFLNQVCHDKCSYVMLAYGL